MSRQLSQLARDSGVAGTADAAESSTTLESVFTSTRRDPDIDELRASVRAALTLEAEALDSRDDVRRSAFDAAFGCWSKVLLAGATGESALAEDEDELDPKLSLALHLAATGSGSARVTEVRQALASLVPASDADLSERGDWAYDVLRDATVAVVLLSRKGHDWDDITRALDLLSSVRARQEVNEGQFLDRANDAQTAATRLVAIYHLAQMVTVAGKYIETGEGAYAGVRARLDTHLRQADQAAELAAAPGLARVGRLMHAAITPMVERSIWAQVEQLGDAAQLLAQALADRRRHGPTLELWPSQIQALGSGLLDSYRNAVVVEMPTSAGKTLLAKFSIAQALTLRAGALVAYVVPTRVLVNQVTDELRRDLRPLGKRVEQAIPVFDIDPTEDILLRTRPNVLVTTPEKLDLLVREQHPVVDDLSLVIVDEAHNIADNGRGARLELLLATIKRDKPGARYLLLSPFLSNASDLVKWLGSGRGSQAPIKVDWRPNKKIVGALTIRARRDPSDGRRRIRNVEFRAAASADNGGIEPGTTIDLGVTPMTHATLAGLVEHGERALSDRGPTLIVCSGRAASMIRAKKIAAERPERPHPEFGQAVIRHVETELGVDSDLAYAIRRGVAYHHAGVSLETRRLIEALLAEGLVDLVCGTTTLAQGANFPLTNVLIESRRVGNNDLTHPQFWNIAGRAGRGMLAGTGLVAFAVADSEQQTWWDRFLRDEATVIASQLADVIAKADEIEGQFDLSTVRRVDHLSEFMQYLAHAMRVSGSLQSSNEIEDLLRSSLMYTVTEDHSPEDAAQLVTVCRRYLDSIRGQGRLLSLADGTGFSTSTVRYLQAQLHDAPQVRDAQTWDPAHLFGRDTAALAERIKMIGDLPEMRLGEERSGPFNPERIARIVRDWVNGVSIPNLVEAHGDARKKPESRHAAFVSYVQGTLASTASWGLAALEKVALGGGEITNDAKHVSAMVLYGVNAKEAVWLRMAGLSREVAIGGAKLWREQRRPEPGTFDEIRSWIEQVDDNDWQRVTAQTAFVGGDVNLLWRKTAV